MKISNFKFNDKVGIYIVSVLIIFVTASTEYDARTAIFLIFKATVFCLSMMFPILLSAKLSTIGTSSVVGLDHLFRLDAAALIFCVIQVTLWIIGYSELQLYILGIGTALLIITFFMFIFVRRF